MKIHATAGAILVLAAFGVLAQPPSRSTWDGVYTEAQAERGRVLYSHECLDCHGDDLEGDVVEHPGLAGGAFVYKWNSQTVGDLFERIHRDMPMDHPGTLTRQKAADLTAFLLNFNKFPPGDQELPPDLTALRQIRIDARNPDQKK
jgi:cytochrome c